MVENFALGNIVWYTHVPIQGAHRQNANIPPMGCLQGGRILLQDVFVSFQMKSMFGMKGGSLS